jgi:hypothetical protein
MDLRNEKPDHRVTAEILSFQGAIEERRAAQVADLRHDRTVTAPSLSAETVLIDGKLHDYGLRCHGVRGYRCFIPPVASS